MGNRRKSAANAAAVNTEVEVIATNTDDAVAAALAMIDLELAGEAAVTASIEAIVEEAVEIEAVDMDAALAELNAAAAAPATSTKTPKATSTKTPKAAAAPTRAFSTVSSMDEAELKTNLDGITAKKVIEKAQNVLQAVESGKKLSRYTADAIKALARDGKVTGKSLVQEFLGAGLKDGTARAQAQQMTALFKAFGIALPDPATSELIIADQGLVDELVRLAA